MKRIQDLSEGDVNSSPHRARWLEQHEDEATRKWLEADARYFLHQNLSTPCLDVLDTCRGATLRDLAGREFLDFHGNSLHQVGYSHPRVIRAIKDQLDRLSFCPRRFTNIPAVELARTLAEIAPGHLNRSLFAPGGTTAVGMALKLARMATGRHKTLSMWGSFHGASLDVISVGGEALFRSGVGPLLPGAGHVPPPDPADCLWDPSGDCTRCGLKCARYVEYVMEHEGDVAAVIAEPLRCTTVSLPPPGYWEAVRSICDRHGALLIFDETAVCLGRTGRMFACEHFDAVPDVLVLGKGLGGGIFPMAAMIAEESLNIAGHAALGHYTHEKNPVGCAAAVATIGCLREEGLTARAERLGIEVLDRLEKLRKHQPLIRAVRGLGMLFGVELTSAEAADRALYACLERGLSFKVSSGRVLTLAPPLNISEDELDRALFILEQALAETAQGR